MEGGKQRTRTRKDDSAFSRCVVSLGRIYIIPLSRIALKLWIYTTELFRLCTTSPHRHGMDIQHSYTRTGPPRSLLPLRHSVERSMNYTGPPRFNLCNFILLSYLLLAAIIPKCPKQTQQQLRWASDPAKTRRATRTAATAYRRCPLPTWRIRRMRRLGRCHLRLEKKRDLMERQTDRGGRRRRGRVSDGTPVIVISLLPGIPCFSVLLACSALLAPCSVLGAPCSLLL